jgi:Tfp pilus assembly protein PilX
MIPVVSVLADAADTKMSGGFGLIVVLVLAIVVYFLFLSMTRHLRKVARMKADEEAAAKAEKAGEKPAPEREPRH